MNSINQTAAVLCGAAVRKTFPHETYLGSGLDPFGFFCEFSFSDPFQEAFLSLIENAMKEQRDESITLMEMIPSNARELLIHHEMHALAEKTREKKGTVHIAKLGKFVDLFEGEILESRYFTLLGFEQKGGVVRVFGGAFVSDRDRKAFQKKYQQYPRKAHTTVAKKLDLYEESAWHPRGMQMRRILIDLWREFTTEMGFEEIGICSSAEKVYFQKTGRTRFGYWSGLEDHLVDFESRCVFILKKIEAFIKIFDFETVEIIKCSSKRVEVHISDGLGRMWMGPYLEVDKESVQFALFGNLECFIALLLEKHYEKLPFWLCPEQIRLIPFDGTDPSEVIEIFNRLRLRYTVDDRPYSVREKMQGALRIKVPYVIFFGKKEERAKLVTIRAYGSKRDEALTYEKLEEFFCKRKRKFEDQ